MHGGSETCDGINWETWRMLEIEETEKETFKSSQHRSLSRWRRKMKTMKMHNDK
jgi:hypothetical protein